YAFFFSSRRRHTRFSRDWSSDVCSSDLAPAIDDGQLAAKGVRFATLKPAVDGQIDISVVVLPGPAGGELAIVNRWRDQVGLPPKIGRASCRERVEVGGGGGVVAEKCVSR